MSTRILLADDHKMTLDGLCCLFKKQEGVEVVGMVSDGRAAVLLAGKLQPDVVIMDVHIPGWSGIDAARQIIGKVPNVKLIVLSIYSNMHFVEDALKAGVSGYLVKQSGFNELVAAVETVLKGQIYLSSKITGIVVDSYIKRPCSEANTLLAVLSNRQRDIMRLLAEGKSSKQIALIIRMSVKTVDAYRREIMRKLHIDSFAGLVKYAIREGLTTLEH
ncbi:MAG TPA: response regulator transcription factor [Sedimentisphaerales bacterium]|nr:response regulator transcription factor [Sedimentisphaerales bacterium]